MNTTEVNTTEAQIFSALRRLNTVTSGGYTINVVDDNYQLVKDYNQKIFHGNFMDRGIFYLCLCAYIEGIWVGKKGLTL